MFSLLPILIHSDAVPPAARDALRAAHTAAPDQRDAALAAAARALRHTTELDCTEARSLVGLPPAAESC
jgi:hypothetical protein